MKHSKRLLALQSDLQSLGVHTDNEFPGVLCLNIGETHYVSIDYASERGRTVVLQVMSFDGSTCLFDYRSTCLVDVVHLVRTLQAVSAGTEHNPEPIVLCEHAPCSRQATDGGLCKECHHAPFGSADGSHCNGCSD